MFSTLNQQINDRFDHVLLEISGFKREMATVKSSITDMGASLTKTSDRVSHLESVKIPDLCEKIKKCRERIR